MIEVPIEMEVSTSYQPRTSGASDYSELTNKPSINGTELVGDKSLSSLGIQGELVSGTNIKTINSQSLLGAGNINVSGGGGEISDDVKVALLNCFQNVVWTTASGQEYYTALYNALYNIEPHVLESITAVFTQGSAVIYDSATLESLKEYLVVTANYSDSTTETVTNYTLSGTLTVGTSTITVAYGEKTTTFTVNVSEVPDWPTGTLNAVRTVDLPSPTSGNNGFTCTGLARDGNTWLIGDIGKSTPSIGTISSQIVRTSWDFSTILETIPLAATYSGMGDVQGVAVDTSDNTIWFVSPDKRKVYNMTKSGTPIRDISTTAKPTGVAYDASDDTLWILTYSNTIINTSKTGTVIGSYKFAYSDTLDQGYIYNGVLYITAGTDYSNRNNIYYFDTTTHEQGIACTVDSYSVEGLWVDETQMVIVNDGYYHSAYVGRNVANFYKDSSASELSSITATYTQTSIVTEDTLLEELTSDLVVTAHYADNSIKIIPANEYSLSGTLDSSTSTITVSYENKSTTFDVIVTQDQTIYSITNNLTGCITSNSVTSVVEGSSYSATISAEAGYIMTGATVSITMGNNEISSTAYNNGVITISSVTGDIVVTITAAAAMLSSISAIYTQGSTVVCPSTSLDSLRTDLVVTATYSDSSTSVITDYALSGTLSVGTSSVTVSYGGKTTTFTVDVTENIFDPTTAPDVTWEINTGTMKIKNGRVQYWASYVPITGGKKYRITKDVADAFRVCTTAIEPALTVDVIETEANHTGTELTITTSASANYLYIIYGYDKSGTTYDKQTVRNSITVTSSEWDYN